MSVIIKEDISKYFQGNFYINFDEFYYVFENFGFQGIKNNINFNTTAFKFLQNCKVKLITNSENTPEININFSNYSKNYIYFKDLSICQNFSLELQVFEKDSLIFTKVISINDYLNKYKNIYDEEINLNETLMLFIIKDFYPEIDLKRALCLNCTNEDLINASNTYNINNFYWIHKMNKILNFKWLDYKIYSTFLTKKIFKDRDLIVYKADKNNSLEYQFDYSVLEQDEKIKVSNFFYKIKDFLNKLNFNSEVDQIYSINSNKRRIPLYIQQFPVINQKNYFNFIFQQNLKNII